MFAAPTSCGSPDKLVNTTISGSNFSVGATISYRCPEGHMLVGGENRTCTEKGFWSGHAPTCKCKEINYCAVVSMTELAQEGQFLLSLTFTALALKESRSSRQYQRRSDRSFASSYRFVFSHAILRVLETKIYTSSGGKYTLYTLHA